MSFAFYFVVIAFFGYANFIYKKRPRNWVMIISATGSILAYFPFQVFVFESHTGSLVETITVALVAFLVPLILFFFFHVFLALRLLTNTPIHSLLNPLLLDTRLDRLFFFLIYNDFQSRSYF